MLPGMDPIGESWKQKWVAWGEQILAHDLLECEVPSCPVPPAPRNPWREEYDRRAEESRSYRKSFETVKAITSLSARENVTTRYVDGVGSFVEERRKAAKLRKIRTESTNTTTRYVEVVVPEAPIIRSPRQTILEVRAEVAARAALDEALAEIAPFVESLLGEKPLSAAAVSRKPRSEVYVPEHIGGYPCGREIMPKQVPWVDHYD